MPPTIPFTKLAEVGPFFALQRPAPDQPGWLDVGRLLDDETAVDAAIDLYAGRLRTGRRDIAGSLLVQGWAGRLTSVFAGCAALSGGVPDLAAANLRYRFVPAAPIDLAASDTQLADITTGWRRLVESHLEPLLAAVDAGSGAGRRRLWGNVAAAMAGSLLGLARSGDRELEGLLELPWAQPVELAGLGQWLLTEGGWCYARRTCCNLVRVAGYDLCADCVIAWHPRLRSARHSSRRS